MHCDINVGIYQQILRAIWLTSDKIASYEVKILNRMTANNKSLIGWQDIATNQNNTFYYHIWLTKLGILCGISTNSHDMKFLIFKKSYISHKFIFPIFTKFRSICCYMTRLFCTCVCVLLRTCMFTFICRVNSTKQENELQIDCLEQLTYVIQYEVYEVLSCTEVVV